MFRTCKYNVYEKPSIINFSMKLFAVSDSLCIFAMDAEEMRRSDIELHITRRILLQACSSSLHNG